MIPNGTDGGVKAPDPDLGEVPYLCENQLQDKVKFYLYSVEDDGTLVQISDQPLNLMSAQNIDEILDAADGSRDFYLGAYLDADTSNYSENAGVVTMYSGAHYHSKIVVTASQLEQIS